MYVNDNGVATDIYREDIYFNLGENGDGTGSPYLDLTDQDDIYTLQQQQQSAMSTTSVNESGGVKTTDGKPWYDVISQIGGTIVDGINAIKSNPGYNSNLNYAAYQQQQQDEENRKKWMWIILAVLAIGILAFFAFRKDSK